MTKRESDELYGIPENASGTAPPMNPLVEQDGESSSRMTVVTYHRQYLLLVRVKMVAQVEVVITRVLGMGLEPG